MTIAEDAVTARIYDINDFMEVVCPISKVGIFEYSGAQISADLPPDQIYGVYRSEQELNNPETIESFKLIPFTDEHCMLSGDASDELTDSSDKGVHGTTGETVEFNAPYLTANVKIFSGKLMNLIDNGKRELSIGYRCVYEAQNGEYDGKQYHFLQTNIRGNHLALVQEGRSGHDVSVLDAFTFTLDSEDLKMPKLFTGEKMTFETMHDAIKKVSDALDAMELEAKEKTEDTANPDDFVHLNNGIDESEAEKAEDETEEEAKDESEAEKAEDESEEEAEDEAEEEKGAMDSKTLKHVMTQISARDSLAKRLSSHIGTFDHATKTMDEVAVYGAKKLGLRCADDVARHVVEGYLFGAKQQSVIVAQDNRIASTSIDSYLKGV